MTYETVIYEKEGNIARVTLNRPEKRNAFPFPGQGGLTDDFHAALTEAEEDDDIKVVVIKAAGPDFSAGHDLSTVGFVYGYGTGKAGERRPSQRIRLKVDKKAFGDYHERLFLFPKITIAQVHGHCLGEGLIVVECCDLAVAAEDAKLGHPEQRIAHGGVLPSPVIFLTVGLKRGLELMLTGRLIDGKEAERIGLVNKAVPAGKLEEETNKLAQTICLLGRDSIAIGKTARRMAYNSMGLTEGFDQQYIFHAFGTNIRWEPDEYSFFKQRRDKGTKAGFKGLEK